MKREEVQCFAWAESTQKTSDYQWKKYVSFCMTVKTTPIPMNYDMITLFMINMAVEGLSYSTISNQLSALVMFAKLYRQDIDIRGDFGVNLTLKALHRILGDSVRVKEEILPNELAEMKQHVVLSDFMELSVWLGILFIYRTLLRKSHIFLGEFNRNLLRRSDIEFFSWGIVVHVSKSKTIQFAERKVTIPVSRDNGPLCLVTALRDYFHKYPAGLENPILCKIEKGNLVTVKYGPALKTTHAS